MNKTSEYARLGVMAFAAWLFSLPLTVESGSVGAALGAAVALGAITFLSARDTLATLRLSSSLLVGVAFALLGLGIAIGLRDGGPLFRLASRGISGLSNPLSLYYVGEFVAAFALAAAVCGGLRLGALRGGVGRLAEAFFVACAVVFTFTAHRNGLIDRPFALGDFALIRGYDPVYLLMLIGAAALSVLIVINLQNSTPRRSAYHLLVLSVAGLCFVAFVRYYGLPLPELTNDLGLTGQQGGSAQEQNPFQDSTNDPKDKAAPVAVVVFHDDYTPANGSYYFRESAYSQFNGSRIDYATRADMDTDLLTGFQSRPAELDYAIQPESQAPRQTVRTTIGTLVPHRAPFGLDTPTQFARTANPNATRFDTTYEALSSVPLFDPTVLVGRETGAANWSNAVQNEYLKMPDDPRYRTLAESLITPLKTRYADDPFARAWVIKQYLDENGIYSLKNAHASEPDPAAAFLFGDLTGYCVHFAFSAVYLYRSLGIPARVGVGYSVPASNRAGGSSLLIQAIHGHAWPEVYFRGIGWVIIDPAPQQTLVDMTTDPQDNLQQLLGDMLRDDASFAAFVDSRAAAGFDFAQLFRRILQILATLIAGMIALAYLVKLTGRFAPHFSAQDAQHRTTFKANLDRLAGLGIKRQYGESREDFALRCAPYAPSFDSLTQAHLNAALNTAALDVDWRSLDTSLRTEIRDHFPLWRRLLGALHPFSWLAAR